MLAVHTSLHGKGVGSLLLSYAEESMKMEGLKQSGCQVVSPIPRLQGYYERRGYYTTGETEQWISDNLKEEAWFMMMRKNLVVAPSSTS
jgi:ribosomal protein S18 acetylase RimI-like enzyme